MVSYATYTTIPPTTPSSVDVSLAEYTHTARCHPGVLLRARAPCISTGALRILVSNTRPTLLSPYKRDGQTVSVRSYRTGRCCTRIRLSRAKTPSLALNRTPLRPVRYGPVCHGLSVGSGPLRSGPSRPRGALPLPPSSGPRVASHNATMPRALLQIQHNLKKCGRARGWAVGG